MKKLLKLLLPALSLLGDAAIIGVLHETFQKHPKLKRLFTEALLTYDTESMNLTPENDKK